MLILLVISWVLTALYIVLFLAYAKGWHRQEDFSVAPAFRSSTSISVVIPARNEAGNIGKCIQSILNNHYPQHVFEIIVIDDHSTDNTAEIVSAFGLEYVRCLKLEDYLEHGEKLNSYKKKALETAIMHSKGDLIVTTDADCIVPENWLRSIAAIYEKEQPVMIAAPVAYDDTSSAAKLFQSLDFMSMQGITAAAHRLKLGNMSNGANLAFSRRAFEEVNGYEGVDHLASGDDFLLMMKMQKAFPGRIAFLKSQEAIVQTAPQPNWSSFINQRVRWASKSGKYDDKRLTAILILVYLFNVMLVAIAVAGFFEHFFWLLLLGVLFIKTFIELYFLVPVAGFFNKSSELKWFPLLQPLHILYIVVAGFLGFVGKYQWKGRTVR